MSKPTRNVLRMVAELHLRGYQRLRIVPHIYHLGTWRCGVTYARNVRIDHGAFALSWDHEVLPQYSSASESQYFDWTDARHATPSRLARLFIERFPAIAELGYGPDLQYAGWYIHLLHLTHPDALPYVFAEFAQPEWYLYTTREGLKIPLPPAGHGTREETDKHTEFTFRFHQV